MVNEFNTAKALGSGDLQVFSTPSMIALMESTCASSVSSFLETEKGTVGTRVDVAHVAATPVGMLVRCESELTQIDGRKLVFSVRAYDDAGLIGQGQHERFIIDNVRFFQKAQAKLSGK